MKYSLFLMSVFCFVQSPLHAQVTVVAPSAATTGVVVVPSSVLVVQSLDSKKIHNHLAKSPKVMVVTAAPQTEVNTTKTTTVVETVGQPTRVYDAQRNVVVVADQGQSRELPYVTLPVLFVKETAKLLDNESHAALQQVADVILAVSKTEPSATYDIEGHTSTDGTDAYNMELSTDRAKRVFEVLTQKYGVPATSLSAHGYGKMYPMFPQGTEAQMQQDRRVLVVRTK